MTSAVAPSCWAALPAFKHSAVRASRCLSPAASNRRGLAHKLLLPFRLRENQSDGKSVRQGKAAQHRCPSRSKCGTCPRPLVICTFPAHFRRIVPPIPALGRHLPRRTLDLVGHPSGCTLQAACYLCIRIPRPAERNRSRRATGARYGAGVAEMPRSILVSWRAPIESQPRECRRNRRLPQLGGCPIKLQRVNTCLMSVPWPARTAVFDLSDNDDV
jgi:hypothetical protein